MSMTERIVFSVVKTGLDFFKADPRRYETFLLRELRLDAAEARNARIYFEGGTTDKGDTVEARPPTLIHGYARTGGPFPCWAMTLGGEREVQSYLNEDGLPVDEDGNVFLDEDDEPADSKIRRVEYTFNIQVIADHPDICLYYYSLLKRCVLRQHGQFEDNDLNDPLISGAELAPDPRFLPHDVFIRQLTIQIEGEECWTEPLDDGTGTSVSGIHVDDTGESKTAGEGSVDAHITTYAAGS
jgi:hypothetical protein